MQFLLPPSYPTKANPIVTFSSKNLSKSEDQSLQIKLNELLSSLSSSTEERLHEIFDYFVTWIPVESVTVLPSTSSEQVSDDKTVITLIWFHHLLSTTKRKAILSIQNLKGISKPGYPGILVLQGAKSALAEAITELKQMRWQAIQIRAELETSPEQQISEGIHEVETVAEVVERIDKLGLGEWCLSALRMK